MISSYEKTPGRAVEYLIGILVVMAGLTGCTVSSEKPIFGIQDSVRIEGVDGLYFLFDPWEKDFTNDIAVSVKNGEIEIINLEDCEEKRKCISKPIVVRLPSFENSNVVQFTEEDDEETFYVFVHWLNDYGAACLVIDEDKHGPQIDQIRNIASKYDLDTESRKFKPVVITGNAEPEAVLSFLDEVWLKVPRDVWDCYGLIPEGKPVKGFLDVFRRTVGGTTLED